MIKEYESSEMDEVMDIWLKTNSQTHDFISKNYWIKNFELVKTLLPDPEMFIYEEDGKIQGFIGITDKTYIAGLFVLDEFQSNGIGTKLINECKRRYPILKLNVYVKMVRL